MKESEEVISRSSPLGQSWNRTALEERISRHEMLVELTKAGFLVNNDRNGVKICQHDILSSLGPNLFPRHQANHRGIKIWNCRVLLQLSYFDNLRTVESEVQRGLVT